MVMLQKIEKYVMYRAIIELLEHDEAYNKKRSVINGEELLKLCHERYLLMQELLFPLKEKLGKDIMITNISFAEGLQDDTCIIIEYMNGDKKGYVTLSHLEFDGVETIFNTGNKELKLLIDDNKGLILKTFEEAYRNSFDKEIRISSTSKQFTFNDDNEFFSLRDYLNNGSLLLKINHSDYEKKGQLYLLDDKISVYKNISKKIQESSDILSHAKVYEDELPRVLIKK